MLEFCAKVRKGEVGRGGEVTVKSESWEGVSVCDLLCRERVESVVVREGRDGPEWGSMRRVMSEG